jgi:hypothetical protein
VGTESGNFNTIASKQEASSFGWRIKMKRFVGDIKHSQKNAQIIKKEEDLKHEDSS